MPGPARLNPRKRPARPRGRDPRIYLPAPELSGADSHDTEQASQINAASTDSPSPVSSYDSPSGDPQSGHSGLST